MGKIAYERMKGKSAKVQGMMFANEILWQRRRAGPHGKLMWERVLGSQGKHGDHRGQSKQCLAYQNFAKEARENDGNEEPGHFRGA